MSLESITEKIKTKMNAARGLSARVTFDFGDDGRVFVDTTQTPAEISHDEKESDCTLICSLDTFDGILNGTKDPNIAFMMGQLKVKGSMGLALKLNSVLED